MNTREHPASINLPQPLRKVRDVLDKWADIFGMMIIGGVLVRVATNKNSQATIGTVFHGFAEDTSAALGK